MLMLSQSPPFETLCEICSQQPSYGHHCRIIMNIILSKAIMFSKKNSTSSSSALCFLVSRLGLVKGDCGWRITWRQKNWLSVIFSLIRICANKTISSNKKNNNLGLRLPRGGVEDRSDSWVWHEPVPLVRPKPDDDDNGDDDDDNCCFPNLVSASSSWVRSCPNLSSFSANWRTAASPVPPWSMLYSHDRDHDDCNETWWSIVRSRLKPRSSSWLASTVWSSFSWSCTGWGEVFIFLFF